MSSLHGAERQQPVAERLRALDPGIGAELPVAGLHVLHVLRRVPIRPARLDSPEHRLLLGFPAGTGTSFQISAKVPPVPEGRHPP